MVLNIVAVLKKKNLLREVKNGKMGGENNIEAVLPRRIMEYSMSIPH